MNIDKSIRAKGRKRKSRYARSRRDLRALIDAGGRLSNCAFNMAQSEQVPAEYRLHECRMGWDKARAEWENDSNSYKTA